MPHAALIAETASAFNGGSRLLAALPPLDGHPETDYKKSAGGKCWLHSPPCGTRLPMVFQRIKFSAPVGSLTSYRGNCVTGSASEPPQPQGGWPEIRPAHPGGSASWGTLLSGGVPHAALIAETAPALNACFPAVPSGRRLSLPAARPDRMCGGAARPHPASPLNRAAARPAGSEVFSPAARPAPVPQGVGSSYALCHARATKTRFQGRAI